MACAAVELMIFIASGDVSVYTLNSLAFAAITARKDLMACLEYPHPG